MIKATLARRGCVGGLRINLGGVLLTDSKADNRFGVVATSVPSVSYLLHVSPTAADSDVLGVLIVLDGEITFGAISSLVDPNLPLQLSNQALKLLLTFDLLIQTIPGCPASL